MTLKLINMKATRSLITRTFSLVFATIISIVANAQHKSQDKPAPKFNRNQVLTNGFIAEDMKGLNGSKTKFDMAFGLDLSYFFSPLFSMDLAYDRGKMTGSGTVEYYQSNVEFYTLGANLSLKRSIRTKPYRFVPYVRASIANANFDVERKFKEDDATFSHIKDNCVQLGLGLGIRYHITNNLHLNLMSEFVTSYTDKWDGFDYSNGNDHLVKTSLGLRYTIGKHNHADRALAWQDNRVDDLLAGKTNNNNEVINQTLQALSDSLKVMRESLTAMNTEMKDRMARENADTDKDGVLDRNDVCPDQYGPAYNSGCPDTARVKKAGGETAVAKGDKPVTAQQPSRPARTEEPSGSLSNIDLAAVKKMLLIEMNNIRFPKGKATLDDEALDILNRNAVLMKNNPGFKLVIFGYTDQEGSEKLNMRLSKQRASAVANYLAKRGVPASRLEVRAMGEQNPLDNDGSERANASNRRVEFSVELDK
jgi:outer membrane protein OmpA-like peptidoglycan-associated protein